MKFYNHFIPSKVLSVTPGVSLTKKLFIYTATLTIYTTTLTNNLTAQRFGLHEKSYIEVVLKKNRDKDLAANRNALKKAFPKIINKAGNLTGLCNFLRKLDDPRAKHLLAFTLVASKQYKSALEVLNTLAKETKVDSWVTTEIVRVKGFIDQQNTWNAMNTANKPTSISDLEKMQVNEILELKLSAATVLMKTNIIQLLKKYGELTPLINYLSEGEKTQNKQVFISMASLNDGDLANAAVALEELVSQENINPWIIGQYGRIKEMRGETSQAIKFFKLAINETQDSQMKVALRIRTAQLLYDTNREKQAAKILLHIVNQAPAESVELRNYCARIAALYGDYKLATKWFTPTGEKKKLLLNKAFLGDLHLKLGQINKAYKIFESCLPLAGLPRDRRYILDRVIHTARLSNKLPQVADKLAKSENISPERMKILINLLGGELGQIDKLFTLTNRKDLPEKTKKILNSPSLQIKLAELVSSADTSWDPATYFVKLMKQFPKEASYRDGYVQLLLLEGKRNDAIKVYNDIIADTTDNNVLMDVASGAQITGLMNVSRKAAKKAFDSSDNDQLSSGLFTASLYTEEGKSEEAIKIISELEKKLKADDAAGMMALSSAYERLKNNVSATKLCRQAYKITGNERTLRKLISLLEEQDRNKEAFDLWKELWLSAKVPMTIIQASERILDLGAKSGKLADIAIELEDIIAERELNDRELTLLLDIYTSIGDPVSAADILISISKKEDNGLKLQKRLLEVYMKCELFGKCTKILKKLMVIDPKEKDEYLRLLAIIALERGNNGDAMVVLEELALRSKDGVLRDSFSASVLNMLGRNANAATAFRRSIAAKPDEVETWLLWGNALDEMDEKERVKFENKGERPPARVTQIGNIKTRALFTMMMEEALDDDLFVICVDGLLNASAPRQSILNALRRLNSRIAAKPHNLLLYRLSADLNEEIKRFNKVYDVIDMAVPIAGDSRSFIIRELISIAKGSKELGPEIEIQHGRSLLNITKHLPPAECLNLGHNLMKRGYTSEAEVAFQRILSDSDAVGTARDVVTKYESAGLFEKASIIIRKLIIQNPYDIQLHLRLALLKEKNGNYTEASDIYVKLLEIMISQESVRISSTTKNRLTKTNRKISITEASQFYDSVVRGFILCTRTAEAQTEALEKIKQIMDAEIAQLAANKSVAKKIDHNPRLLRISSLLRRLSFVFNNSILADENDLQLLKLYPNDNKISDYAYNDRLKWISQSAARNFRSKHLKNMTSTNIVGTYFKSKEEIETMTKNTSLNSEDSLTATSLSTMLGHDDLIKNTLKGIDFDFDVKSRGGESQLLATTGVATKNPELVRKVLFAELRRVRMSMANLGGFDKARARQRPAKTFKLIIAAWPVLNTQDRSSITNLYGMIIKNGYEVGIFTSTYHYLLSISGRAREIPMEALYYYMGCKKGGGSYYHTRNLLHAHVSTMVEKWITASPPAERVAAINQFLEGRTGKERTSLVNKLPRYIPSDIVTPEMLEAFPILGQRPWNLKNVNLKFSYSDSEMEKKRIEFDKAITSQLRRMGDDPRALFNLHHFTLRPAANILSRKHLDILNSNYLESKDPFKQIVAFLLFKHAGRDIEALALLNNIKTLSTKSSKSQAALAVLPKFLNFYGWKIPSYNVLQRNNTANIENIRINISRQDPLAILKNNSGDVISQGINRMYAAQLMKSEKQFKQAVSSYQADTRHPDITLNRRNFYKASNWPDKIALSAYGLENTNSRLTESIVSDVVNIKGGQNYLYYLMRSITPGRNTRETLISDQIAINALKIGLSPLIKDNLLAAAKNSSLNFYDYTLLNSFSKLAPNRIPKELSSTIMDLALTKWRGNADLLSKILKVQYRANKYKSQSKKISALANTAQSMRRNDLAKSLGRWSVALDILDNGCPHHLREYLDIFPDLERKQELNYLMPFLGFNNARPLIGTGSDTLLKVLIQEGMLDAANQQTDYYLKFRLPGSSTVLKAASNILDGGSQKVLTGGIVMSYKKTDNTVARCLAILNRPDDYQSLLWRMIMDLKIYRGRKYISTNINPNLLLDITNTLPKPSELQNIDTYLKIHVKLIEKLRYLGSMSIETQVKQYCILGKWCVENNLNQQASNFLEKAEKLSTEMLFTKLWVSDLQKLLGKDDIANKTEINLLNKNLLPLSRVAKTLDRIEKESGENKANFTAYRLSNLTNQHNILSRAQRHAKSEGLKAKFLELSERYRLVNTLFLPKDAPSPFKGYASAKDWSVAISAAAAKLPSTPKPIQINNIIDDAHPAIARAFVKGDKPKVIYVPIIHDSDVTHLNRNGNTDIKIVMDRCSQIANRLYTRYGIRNIQLEGLGKRFVDRYNKIEVQRRNWTGHGQGMLVHQTWGQLLARKSWKLLPTSDKPIVGPLTALGRIYNAKIIQQLDTARTQGWFRNKEVYTKNEKQFNNNLESTANEYNKKLQAILKEDPKLAREYNITVTQRNAKFLEYLLAEDKPGVVFFGASHWQDLKKQLEQKGTSYAVVVPSGVSWPPTIKDEETIYSDMLNLGAQLKKSFLTLGDGTKIIINIPFE